VFKLTVDLKVPKQGEDDIVQKGAPRKPSPKDFCFRVQNMHIGLQHEAIRHISSEDVKKSRKTMMVGCCWDRYGAIMKVVLICPGDHKATVSGFLQQGRSCWAP
jgi:hypothetical protein